MTYAETKKAQQKLVENLRDRLEVIEDNEEIADLASQYANAACEYFDTASMDGAIYDSRGYWWSIGQLKEFIDWAEKRLGL